MSIKSIGSFSPALQPHAEWADQNVGNKDGNLGSEELELLKQKFPDHAQYEGLKAELALVDAPPAASLDAPLVPKAPVPVGQGGGVLGFRLGLANGAVDGPKPAGTDVAATAVKKSLPVDTLTSIGASESGDVFQLDAGGVATMAVRVRQVVDPVKGPATELSLRLTPAQAQRMSDGFTTGQIAGGALAPFQLEKAEFKDGATVLANVDPYQPKVGAYSSTPLNAWKLDEAGKFSVEFVPAKENPQAYRDRLRVRVFGAMDQDRKANLEGAMTRVQGAELVVDADATQSARLQRLSVLRMVAPAKAEELGTRLVDVPLDELDAALAAAGVDAARMAAVKMEEVFPGTLAPVDAALGEKYASLGVKAVMVGVREVDAAVKVLTSNGLMSSLERYGRGLHKAGASLSSDEASGGAEFAFTRLITQGAVDKAASVTSSFGAGKVQLLSVGGPMKQLLSRTDWHAYPNDCFGVTVSRAQAGAGDALAKGEFDKRTSKFTDRPVLEELVALVNGDKAVPGAYSSGSFASSNEACFKNGVAASAFTHVLVQDEATRTAFLEQMKAAGKTELAGRPLEQVVVTATDWKKAAELLGIS